MRAAAVLGFSSLGVRVVGRVAEPLGGGWGWQVLLGTVVLSLIGRVLVLPWDAWSATEWEEGRLVGYVTPKLIEKRFPDVSNG